MKSLASIVFLAVFSVSGFGQSGSSVISGNVKDPTGAVIADALLQSMEARINRRRGR